MGWTFVGRASTPADNGTDGNNPQSVAPPAGGQAGDLAVLIGCGKGTPGTPSISEASGQTWTQLEDGGGAQRAAMWWCSFTGTWGTNPAVSWVTVTCPTTYLLVFRPDAGETVGFDVDAAATSFGGPTTPFDVTITGITTTVADDLVIALWFSADDNTWALQTVGWSNPTDTQIRNLVSTDASLSVGYQVFASAGATGNVTNRQTALEGDGGVRYIVAFKAEAGAPGPQTLTGATFTKAPTFPQGTLATVYDVTGTTFALAPTFAQGSIQAVYELTGTTFAKAPTFPQGTVSQPGAFDPLNLQANVTGSTAALSWDASTGVTDYAIFRRSPRTGAAFNPLSDTPVATTALTTYNDEGLGAGEYEWQVFGRTVV